MAFNTVSIDLPLLGIKLSTDAGDVSPFGPTGPRGPRLPGGPR